MPKSIIFIMFFCIISMMACQNSQLDESLLIGKWKAVSWDVEGQQKGRDASSVRFEFQENKTYQAQYGTQQEQGTYYIMNGKLYTTEEGKAQKNVLLSTLTKDSIVMQMNRMGTLEKITLLKE